MPDLKTPVAFLIFNRPTQTARVFEQIRAARPQTLLVVADGPRGEAEEARCDAARAVLRGVDWKCDLRVNFAEKNLGCRKRVSSGLDWVFDQVDRAIILEDDCLPDPTFFPFCTELLDRYQDNEQIAMIGGVNLQDGQRRTAWSYYFSRITHIWGWATWRRAWKNYDVRMTRWPTVRQTNWLEALFGDSSVAAFYRDNLDRIHSGEVDTWDFQWALSVLLNDGLTILPETNLISNIGFGPDATHTRSVDSRDSQVPLDAMKFPLRHPQQIQVCEQADRYTFANRFGLNPPERRQAA
ncbi:MAG: glycosyltransferase family 2 protein [Tepidisphaeraceae bacterium]